MNKKIILGSTTTLSLILPIIAFAQITFQTLATNIMNVAVNTTMIIAGGFVVIMFVIAGFKYLTAQGDPGQVLQAHKAAIWGTVGVVVIVIARLMITLVCNQLNLTC